MNRCTAKRTRAHEKIIRVMLRQIFRGELTVGSKLPTERTLARTFELNRATVREALRHLENLELIAIRQGDGAYVRNFLESGNLQVVKEMIRVDITMQREVLTALMEVRRTNMAEMAYTAALRRSPAHLQDLEKAALHCSDQSVMMRDQQIHHIIARASGNILNVLLINFFEDLFQDFGALYFEDGRHCRRSEKFHREIYAAVAQQHAGQARSIMRDVLQYAEAAVVASLNEQQQAAQGIIA